MSLRKLKRQVQKAQSELPPIRLDLGCGRNKQPDFTGVDLYSPDADVKLDLFQFQFWPWADDSVSEIYCSHFLEHVPHRFRWTFMEECWRILKVEAQMKIMVPSWKSERAYGDMTHEWPPVTAMFFFYLNKGWREANKLTYGAYDLKCNFDNQAGPAGIVPEFVSRSVEAQQFACVRYLETYADMWVILTKKPL